MNTPLTEVYGEPISVYTKEQAIEDGILIRVGFLSNLKLPVIFTTNLFNDVKDNYREIITRGLELLNKKDPEDDGYYKLRVIEKDPSVIANSEGVTLVKPEIIIVHFCGENFSRNLTFSALSINRQRRLCWAAFS